MHEQYPHVQRLSPPLVPWSGRSLNYLVEWWPLYRRQLGFSYKGRYFKGSTSTMALAE